MLCRRKQPIGKWHTVNKWLCAFVILSSGPPLSLISSLLSYLTYLSLPMGQDDILTSSSDFYMCHAQLYTHGHAYMPLLYGHCSLHPSIHPSTIYPSIYPSSHSFIYSSLYLSIYSSTYIYLFIHLYIYLFIQLSTHSFIHPFVHLAKAIHVTEILKTTFQLQWYGMGTSSVSTQESYMLMYIVI